MRLAACLGVPLEIIEPCGFPLSDRALKRAALDYEANADIRRHDSWTAYLSTRAAEAQPGRLVLFTTKGAEPLPGFRFRTGDTLLMGRESAGVPDEVHQAADARVVIPITPETRSLNLVTAAAIGLGAALGQTRGFPEWRGAEFPPNTRP